MPESIVCVPLPSKVTVFVPGVNVPASLQLPVTFIFPLGAVRLPEIVMLLNVSVLLPLIVVVPLNVTVPPFALKVPALIQLPATFIFAAGAVSVLDETMSMLLKELVLPPLIVVVPSNVTVPPFALKVPKLTQLPETFMFAAGAVNVLDAAMSMLLKEALLLPLITVVPSKVTVPPFGLKAPELTQLPATFMFPFSGAVSVLDTAISRLLKEFVLAPVIAVVPSKVTVPLFALKVPELAQFPESIRFPLGAVNVPEDIVT